MSSQNRVLSIYKCLKPKRHRNYHLWYLLATIPVPQKCSKFQRMRGYNCFFIIEKGPFMDMVQLGLQINWFPLKKGMTASTCSKKHSTLENTRSLQVVSWKNDGNAQMYSCKCSFELTIRLNWNICQIHCMYSIHGC